MPSLILFDKNNSENARKANNSNVKKIQFEDIEFNKKFETTTTNDHTAFYIVTPHFMESIKYLEKN